MKRRLSSVAILLMMIMLIGIFAGCGGSTNEPDTDTSGSTENSSESSTSGTDSPDDSGEGTENTGDETDNGNGDETDNGNGGNPVEPVKPVTLTKVEDVFPDVKEYVTELSRENFKPTTDEKFEAKIEGEDYIAEKTNIPGIKLITDPEFSGGALMQALTKESDELDWEIKYSIAYAITIPRKGYYQLMALTTDLNQAFTSNYSIELDGRTLAVATDKAEVYEDIDFAFNNGQLSNLMFLYDFGVVALEPGTYTLTFTLDSQDCKKDGRLSFFMDYFSLVETVGNVDLEPNMTIGTDISSLEDSEVLKGAAAVSVFDQRIPLKLTFAHYFTESGDFTYTINDYFGKIVYEGTITGEAHDVVTIERLIKNHPVGYFTFKCGRQSFSYVVTPAYSSRTLEDSPFAMDLASYYHIKDLTDCYNVTSAIKLAGVTWVRDRARWNNYEPVQGEYDFSETKDRFDVITSTGMKLLVSLSGSPEWAKEGINDYTGTGVIGGFRDTQIEFYKMCKEMAAYYDGVVDAWELWNESDHVRAPEAAEHFSAWYKAGVLGILDVSPDTRVMFGGYCFPDSEHDYIHLSFLNDILKYSDTYNYHSHKVQPEDYAYVPFASIAMSNEAFASLTLYNSTLCRPTWVTEAGMRVDNMVQESFDQKANYLITSTVESLSLGTEKHFWFVAAPFMEDGGDKGVFSPDLEPYSMLAAEATMTRVLGKGEYVGMPANLTKTALGYTFYTGEHYASVLWSEREGDRYVIETDYPVLVTDMMGGETLLQPEGGKVTVRFGTHPVFVTYSEKPEILSQELSKDEMSELTFTAGEKVILSPEFENYNINDKDSRKYGHIIGDGSKINVRVTNLNGFEVKGTVSATLMGFDVLGCDTEITLAPYSEGYVTLTLKKTGDEAVSSYISFVGTFNGETTSRAAAHVRTEGATDNGEIRFEGLTEGQAMSVEKDLNNITAKLTGAEGTPVVIINDKVFENYTYENGVFTLKLYGMENGRYTLIVAVETDGGDYIFENLFFVVEDGKYTFVQVPVYKKPTPTPEPETPTDPAPGEDETCDHKKNTAEWTVDAKDPQYETSTCSKCGETLKQFATKTNEGLVKFDPQTIKNQTKSSNAKTEIKTDGGMSYVRFNPVDATSNKRIDLHVSDDHPLTNIGGFVAILYRTSVKQDLKIALDSQNVSVNTGAIQTIDTTKTDEEWQIAILPIAINDYFNGEKLTLVSFFPFTVERALTDYTDVAYIGFFTSEEAARVQLAVYEDAYGIVIAEEKEEIDYYFGINANTNLNGTKLGDKNGTSAPVTFDCSDKALESAESLRFGGWFATPGGIKEYGFYVVDGSAKSEYTYLFTGKDLGESFLSNVNKGGRDWDVNSLKGANVSPKDEAAGTQGAAIDLAAYAGKTVTVIVVAKTNNGAEIELVYFNGVDLTNVTVTTEPEKVEYFFNINSNTNLNGDKLGVNQPGTNAPVTYDCASKPLVTAESLRFGGWFATPGGISEYGFYVVDGSAKSDYSKLCVGTKLADSVLTNNINVGGRNWDASCLQGANVGEDKVAGTKGAAIDLAAYAGKTVTVIVVAKTNNGAEIELVYFNGVSVPT